MNLITIVFATLTIAVHSLIFFIESFYWLEPVVYERALSKTGVSSTTSLYEQAQILEVLFYNQGFYNLFVALGGIVGLLLYRIGKTQAGIALVCNMCCFAFGAGVILASSTTAYLGVVLQGLPPLIALLGLYLSFSSQAKGVN